MGRVFVTDRGIVTLPRVGDGGSTGDAAADAALVERARVGDHDAFAAIHRRYDRELTEFCTSLVRDPVAAVEVVQHSFAVLVERIDSLRDTSKLRAWLYAVARHECYRQLRHASRTRPSDSMVEQADPVHDVEAEATTDDLSDLRPLVLLAAEGLSERDRLLYDLHTVGRLERHEVAAAIGVRPAHAAVLVNRFEKTMARSVSALGALRRNGGRCDEIDQLAPDGPADFDQLARKRLVRHVERCPICATAGAAFTEAVVGRLRSLAPLAAAGLGAVALADRGARSTPVTFDRTSFRWRRDGFPSSGGSAVSKVVVAAGAAAVATALVVIPGPGPETAESAQPGAVPPVSIPSADRTSPTTPSEPSPSTTTPTTIEVSTDPDAPTTTTTTTAVDDVAGPPGPIRLVTPAAPPTTTPLGDPAPTPPPPPPGPDMTPPTVGDLTSTNGLAGNPDHRKVWERRDGGGCDGNPTSTVISLAVADAGGVDRVELQWDAMIFEGTTMMADRGDGTWTTTLGDYADDTVTGGAEFRQVLLNAYAYDLAGNVTNEKLSIFVIDCP